jgi:hypothetical protein
LLGHKAGIDEQSEIEANLFGIALLEMDGYDRAAEYLKEKLIVDSGIAYEDFETEFNQDFEITEEELDRWMNLPAGDSNIEE